MRNSAFPLNVQTTFVEDLNRLVGIPGATDTVALADTAASEDQARFLADSLDMLANYHERQTPPARVIVRGTLVGRDRAGVIVVPAQVDYAIWMSRSWFFANRRNLASPRRGAWLSGQMSPLAKKNFEGLGWVIHEKTSL